MLKDRRTWLVLAHCYNMDGRAASHTVTDKIPHLLDAGIELVVLSAATGEKDARVKHVQVTSPAPSGLRFELRHILKKNVRNNLLRAVVKILYDIVLIIPYALEKLFIKRDSQWSWYLRAAPAGRELIRKHGISVIYSTAGPPSTHYAAYLLAKETGLPWLAEIHDPLWVEGSGKLSPEARFRRRLEGLICRHATQFWFFTENALQSARERYLEIEDRGHVILPGCEPPDFGNVSYQRGSTMRIGHFGSLSETRSLEGVIRALSKIADEDPRFADSVELEIVGGPLDRSTQKAISECANVRVRFVPRLSRQKALEKMRGMDLLLLILGRGDDRADYIPSKFYEYTFTHRPILGVLKDNQQLSEMLTANGHFAVDESNVVVALQDVFRTWSTEGLADQTPKRIYSAENAVRRIVELDL